MSELATPAGRGAPVPRGLRLAEMLTLRDQSDETGRLLLEDSASKKARRKATSLGVPMKTARCPYEDTPSRYGHLMNVSAYDALRRDLSEVLNGFAWLTESYLALDVPAQGRIQCLVVISKLGVTVPLLLFYRGDDPVPPHGSLPSYVASSFKASRGLFSAAVAMMNTKGAETKTTGGEVVEFAEEHGHLVRPETRRVCAAPTRLIERTIDVTLGGRGGDASRSRLKELLEFERLWQFYLLEEALGQACTRYKFLLEEVTERVRAEGDDPTSVFEQVVRQGSMRATFGEITEGLMQYATEVEARLNRVLGRADSGSAIGFEELLKMF